MIKTRSDALLVWQVNTSSPGGSSVVVTNTPLLVTLSAGNALVGTINTIAIGAGGNVTVVNSGGLFAMQSGAWTVAVSNTGGSVVVSNTQTSINIINSAGWVFAQSNTDNQGVIVRNSGGLYAMQSGVWTVSSTILNSAGWSVVVSNTQTGINIINSAGWIVAQSNTGGNVNVANSAGWIMFNVESGFPVAVITTVVSTIGLVQILTNNNLRHGVSIYNQSVAPLYLKLGATASTASYTLMMVGSSYYELPKPVYTGLITGIWNSANGFALVTELTG